MAVGSVHGSSLPVAPAGFSQAVNHSGRAREREWALCTHAVCSVCVSPRFVVVVPASVFTEPSQLAE